MLHVGYAALVLALLYDVHGNLPALEAVLADAERQGADGWMLGGDYALFGGWPLETVQRLEQLQPVAWVRGNGERWTGDPDAAPEHVRPACHACAEALGGELVERMAAIAFEHALDDGTRVCHASPISDVRSFLPEPADDEPELLEGVDAPRLVFGHTHLPFRRVSTAGGVELVNPGSVGMPFDGDPRAAYALLHPDRGIEHRRVAYDHRASARRVRDAHGGAPWTELIAARLEQARADPS